MSDIRSVFVDLTKGVDYALGKLGLEEDASLQTAVIISLFTDQRVDEEDDPRGWWADSYSSEPIGSKRWTLKREKATPETLRKLIDFDKKALAWMRKAGLVSEIDISAEWQPGGLLAEQITLSVVNGQDLELTLQEAA